MLAVKDGPNCSPGHPSTSNVLVGVASGVYGLLHGSRSIELVAGPHVRGFASAARSPPFRFSWKSLNGSCGRLVKVPALVLM